MIGALGNLVSALRGAQGGMQGGGGLIGALRGARGSVPPPPTNVPRPVAPNVPRPNFQEPVPGLPQPPAMPAPSGAPMQPPGAGGFMGGKAPGVLDRLFQVIQGVGPQLYQQGEQNRQAMFDRLRQGLQIGHQPMQRSSGIGFRGLPPTGLFGG